MGIIEENHQDGQKKIFDVNIKVLGAFTRCLTMLEKTATHLGRDTFKAFYVDN